MKGVLNQKKEAFKSGNSDRMKSAQAKVKRSLRQAGCDYKEKLEKRLQSNNSQEV